MNVSVVFGMTLLTFVAVYLQLWVGLSGFSLALISALVVGAALLALNVYILNSTDPQKFSTGFDSFTGQNLPAIQEPILSQHEFIIYA